MNKLEKLLFAFTVIILLIGFAFTDLQISQALYNPESSFGHFFETFGELPGALIAVFCMAALITTRNKEKKLENFLSIVGFCILLFLFSFMAAYLPINYLGKGLLPLAPVIAVIYAAAALLLAAKLSKDQKDKIRRAAVIGVLLFVSAILIINLIKMGWGRLRFRSMVEPFDHFSRWYLPQGFTSDNEYMSFPSGHSANSAVIIWITLIPSFIPKLKGSSVLLKIVAFAWILMVMVSRIIVGAHFASDVTLGASISILLFLLLCSWQEKSANKKILVEQI